MYRASRAIFDHSTHTTTPWRYSTGSTFIPRAASRIWLTGSTSWRQLSLRSDFSRHEHGDIIRGVRTFAVCSSRTLKGALNAIQPHGTDVSRRQPYARFPRGDRCILRIRVRVEG